MTPGPVQPPDWVMKAMSGRIIHQRSAEFAMFWQEFQTNLRYLFQTDGQVLAMPGSGSTGVEMAIRGLFKAGETILIQDNGKFSHRWVDFGRETGLEVQEWKAAWGANPVAESLPDVPPPAGIVLTHCETSTGATLDLEVVALQLKQRYPNALILVDAVSTLGALPIYMDDWMLDAVVTASQKALLNPAGICFLALNSRATDRIRRSWADKGNALHPATFLENSERNSYPFTPPFPAFLGVNAALEWIRAETLPVIWNRVHRASRNFKTGIQALGGEIFVPAALQGDSVTAFSFPGREMTKMKSDLVRAGVEMAGGQEVLKGKILRAGHFAQDPEADAAFALEKIKEVLS